MRRLVGATLLVLVAIFAHGKTGQAQSTTGEPVAGPTFAVNTEPHRCYELPAIDSPLVDEQPAGTVWELDLFLQQAGETWHHDLVRGCWIITDPAPVQMFDSREAAEQAALSQRPSAPPSAARPAPTPATPAAGAASSAGSGLRPSGGTCPETHPIKGNRSSSGELIYHVPTGRFYDQTQPEACFATPEDAEAAGYRRSQR